MRLRRAGEGFGGAITTITLLIGAALTAWIPVADEIDPAGSYVLDGTLLPCWSWAGHRELFSGKHQTTGMNVQVLCDLDRNPVWISDSVPGCDHDMAALAASGLLDRLDPRNMLADKGYQESGMITPVKKPIGGDLHESDPRLQHRGQPPACGDRTSHRPPEDLADPAHRPPTPNGNLRGNNHHNNRTVFPPTLVNKSQYVSSYLALGSLCNFLQTTPNYTMCNLSMWRQISCPTGKR
ncbi:hypothetical protein ABIA39_002033 [Nocardia sp. GAS34]|uniref:transposase family protein n=1 Tax=unclassified Nocardia TaxID=2637762 RepID=UPI003D1DE45C